MFFINPDLFRYDMAKSDSFFIRATVASTPGNYNETTIDLGAYVDALGKSVLRIHNVAYEIYETASAGGAGDFNLAANTSATNCWQLTTQTQSGAVASSNKSVISSGTLALSNNSGTANQFTFMADTPDVAPQMWTQGYLVATENIFLGLDVSSACAQLSVDMVLECTVETMSQAAAMALALSQQ